MSETSSSIQTLTTDEIEQVAGGVSVWQTGSGFTTGSLLGDLKLTGGSFRPVTWFDFLGKGKQVYIDGIPIDTEGMLGPRG